MKKMSYTTEDGRITVEFEAANDKDYFRQLAHFQEIYEDNPSAKLGDKVVSGGKVVYRVRKAKYTDEKGKEKEAEYFEKVVIGGELAWFKKSFGVLDDGSDNLFPKRPGDDEKNIERGFNGWHRYKKED